MKKKIMVFLGVVIIVIPLIAWIAYDNTDLEINKIIVESKNIPLEFNGFKIAQVSDLHNAEFGKNNEKLLAMLKEADADIIVITGDIIDSRRIDVDIAISFSKSAVEIAPTYYVNGNHESRVAEKYKILTEGLVKAGVTVLENSFLNIIAEEESITLIGINDPAFETKLYDDSVKKNIRKQVIETIPDNDNYKILLAHRPEYFDEYAGNVDLVFSGHAHGGQFIIPFIGGCIAPGQGLFPEYYEGLYTKGNTNMIVSRGIGNSIFPFRINNKPEIVVVELSKEDY